MDQVLALWVLAHPLGQCWWAPACPQGALATSPRSTEAWSAGKKCRLQPEPWLRVPGLSGPPVGPPRTSLWGFVMCVRWARSQGCPAQRAPSRHPAQAYRPRSPGVPVATGEGPGPSWLAHPPLRGLGILSVVTGLRSWRHGLSEVAQEAFTDGWVVENVAACVGGEGPTAGRPPQAQGGAHCSAPADQVSPGRTALHLRQDLESGARMGGTLGPVLWLWALVAGRGGTGG